MSIRRGVLVGFASCGVYVGGGGLEHVRALEGVKDAGSGAAGSTGSTGTGRAATAVVTVGLVAGGFGAGGHIHAWASVRHTGMLLTGEVLRLAGRDPFLVGSGLCVLAVAAFAVTVTALTGHVEPSGPAYPRILIAGMARVVRGGGVGAGNSVGRPRRGVRRLRAVARRPPTMRATRPGNRPQALRPAPDRPTR